MQEELYKELGRGLFQEAASKRIPIVGAIELTFRCNLRCIHCYSSIETAGQELTASEWKRVLDAVAKEGCLWLLLTGGEPLVRRDFREIYRHAVQNGLLIGLFTNGTLLDQSMVEFLRRWRPFVIEITLHSLRENIHDEISGVAGSFRKTMAGIECLVDAGLRLRLKSVAMKKNRDDLEDIGKFAQGIGAPFRFDPKIYPRVDGDKTPVNWRLDVEEIVELDSRYPDRRASFEDSARPEKLIPQDDLFACYPGLSNFHIDCSGNLVYCTMLREPKWNVLEKGFRKGWDEFYKPFRRMQRPRGSECAGCELISMCGTCPGWSYLCNGNFHDKVGFLCDLAHKRYEAFAGVVAARAEGGGKEA